MIRNNVIKATHTNLKPPINSCMQPKLHPQQTKLRDKRKETNPMQLSL